LSKVRPGKLVLRKLATGESALRLSGHLKNGRIRDRLPARQWMVVYDVPEDLEKKVVFMSAAPWEKRGS
jgi:hypothetical protein